MSWARSRTKKDFNAPRPSLTTGSIGRPLLLSYLLASGSLCSLPGLVLADAQRPAIYRHKGKDGQTAFSDTPFFPGQRPTKLPALIDQEQGLPRAELPKDLRSCHTRGGIDCKRSFEAEEENPFVYCVDGSKSTVERYEEYCTTAEVDETLYVTFSTEPFRRLHREVYKRLQKVDSRAMSGLEVELRNTSSVEAQIASVELRLPFLEPRKVAFEGPTRIPAYGLGTYTLSVDAFPPGHTPRHLAEARIRVRCNNCESIELR